MAIKAVYRIKFVQNEAPCCGVGRRDNEFASQTQYLPGCVGQRLGLGDVLARGVNRMGEVALRSRTTQHFTCVLVNQEGEVRKKSMHGRDLLLDPRI